MRWKTVLAAITLCGLASSSAVGAEPPDLSKVDRQIKKQPSYVAKEPLYGLYLFGPQAQTRVWAVLDKSAADLEQYDVLYFDRNANGDLSEADERIEGKVDKRERTVQFDVGQFKDPNTEEVHTELSVSRRTSDDGSVFLRMQWQGKQPLRGGYAEEAGPYNQFAASPAQAPVLWFDASGQFSFQRWIWTKDLTIGGETDFPVFMGHRGVGKNTFAAVSQEFLPKDVPVLATLIYTDAEGRRRERLNEFLERC